MVLGEVLEPDAPEPSADAGQGHGVAVGSTFFQVLGLHGQPLIEPLVHRDLTERCPLCLVATMHDARVLRLRLPQRAEGTRHLLSLPGDRIRACVDHKTVPNLPLGIRDELLDRIRQSCPLSFSVGASLEQRSRQGLTNHSKGCRDRRFGQPAITVYVPLTVGRDRPSAVPQESMRVPAPLVGLRWSAHCSPKLRTRPSRAILSLPRMERARSLASKPNLSGPRSSSERGSPAGGEPTASASGLTSAPSPPVDRFRHADGSGTPDVDHPAPPGATAVGCELTRPPSRNSIAGTMTMRTMKVMTVGGSHPPGSHTFSAATYQDTFGGPPSGTARRGPPADSQASAIESRDTTARHPRHSGSEGRRWPVHPGLLHLGCSLLCPAWPL